MLDELVQYPVLPTGLCFRSTASSYKKPVQLSVTHLSICASHYHFSLFIPRAVSTMKSLAAALVVLAAGAQAAPVFDTPYAANAPTDGGTPAAA